MAPDSGTSIRFRVRYPLTIAAGVDMPSLALDLALGIPLPAHLDFRGGDVTFSGMFS
jgi:hypothetical protein